MNVGELLARPARATPDKPAIIFGAQTSTYAQLYECAGRLASALTELGLVPGDRVLLLMKNEPALLETMLGCFFGGFTAVPVNARSHPREVAYIAGNCEARVIVHSEEFNEPLASISFGDAMQVSTKPTCGELALDELVSRAGTRAPAEVAPDDLAWLFYTSGTTGHPKGVMITHRMLLNMTLSYFVDVCQLTADDVVLHAAPLTHGSGLFALPALARGNTTVIFDSPSFDADRFFATIQERNVTVVAFLAPTQISKLVQEIEHSRWDLSSLRSVCYGGAPAGARVIREAIDLFGPVFVQIYGQGEAPMTITSLSPDDHCRFAAKGDPRLSSAGLVRAGVRIAIEASSGNWAGVNEIGEVCVQGDVVMAGYWRNEEETAKTMRGDWLHTGDLGYLDPEGYLTLVDRSKDVLITGGNNVYPSEVERVLLEHPDISEASVFGVPDPYWGESVHAVLVLRPGAHLDAQAVAHHCGASLSAYKRPKTVEFVDELPKNNYGKVLKRELRGAVLRSRGSS